MRFVIYGAGAIGGVIGARLHQARHDVALIAGVALRRMPSVYGAVVMLPAARQARDRAAPGALTPDDVLAAAA